MFKPYLLVLLLLMQLNSYGQNVKTQDSIKAVIQQLFVAMQTADTSLAKSCFAKNAVLHSIKSTPGGAEVGENDLGGFLRFLAQTKPGDAEERISWTNEILVDGDLASAWTPYEFYYKGNFSHCGVDSWQLLRTKQGWKIIYLIDTRRKDCTRK